MKRYFFVIPFITVSLYSCVDCEKLSKLYRNDDLQVVLTERPYVYGDMNFIGTKINSKENAKIIMEGRWYRNYKSYMEVGDTVIKRKGELTMYIHKKDTVMAFKWECEGKIYE